MSSFAGKSNKAVLFYFTQNLASDLIWHQGIEAELAASPGTRRCKDEKPSLLPPRTSCLPPLQRSAAYLPALCVPCLYCMPGTRNTHEQDRLTLFSQEGEKKGG